MLKNLFLFNYFLTIYLMLRFARPILLHVVAKEIAPYGSKITCFFNLTANERKFIMAQCIGHDGHKWEIYQDRSNEWRWRRTATNGSIVGASSEGYVNKSDCESNARTNGMTCNPA